MDRMIGGYLAFARGEGTEQAEPVDLSLILDEVAAGARRAGTVLDLDVPAGLTLKLRADAFEPKGDLRLESVSYRGKTFRADRMATPS